jgi:hypothetical protein
MDILTALQALKRRWTNMADKELRKDIVDFLNSPTGDVMPPGVDATEWHVDIIMGQIHERDIERDAHIIGKNMGRSIIGEYNERDAKANKMVNETVDFVNARLNKQRQRAKEWNGGK